MSANALSWSPTLPALLLLASEDHNLYTFDLRHGPPRRADAGVQGARRARDVVRLGADGEWYGLDLLVITIRSPLDAPR
ncbi:hypothetical protein C8J57DRAFT_231425 [Mycena rebaudengoi]|nr:hypothetical protein C8J57DRAFT_231425 [Mycena rebaudengoi]